MSVSLTFNPDHSRTLDKRIRKIDVNVGSLLVTETDDPVLVQAGESQEFDNVANLTLYSPKGAVSTIYYFDEPEVRTPAVRGDSGGKGGSLEARTLKELRAQAKDRGLTGYSKLAKSKLIAELRS